MESLLVSFATVAVAELGDRTQLIAFMLAVRYRRPWPILAGMLLATLAAHVLAGVVGRSFGALLTPGLVDGVVGLGLVVMGVWALKADTADGAIAAKNRGAFVATLVTFFIAEMGDKTQIATAALAAGYPNLFTVIAGSTAGLMAANVPVVFLGKEFETRLPMRAIHVGAAILFGVLGVLFLARAVAYFAGSP
jgi:Ca2+/H+ antiporter, TMEM165/GDT1 family